MKFTQNLFCFILAVVLLFSCVGCEKGDNPSSAIDTGSSSESTSSGSLSSAASSEQSYNGYYDLDTLKPFDTETSSKATVSDSDSQKYEDEVDWSGPRGYVIVVPANNKNAKASAELLKSYFAKSKGVTLSIVTDATAESEREILVGETNRKESNKNLPVSNLEVSIKGEKLVFDGGHDVTVDLAVRWFIRRSPDTRGTCTFSETTDFSSTISGGYKYVWGDEFEGTALDKNLWSDKNSKMGGNNVLIVESTNKTISVQDGSLKLTAYKDDDDRYHVPTSVHSKGTMNFLYGYVEMRAKLSLEVGSFASFWTRSVSDKGSLVEGNYPNHFAEVDMFEIHQRKGKQYAAANILKNSYDTSLIKNWCTAAMPSAQAQIIVDEDYHLWGYEWTPTEIKLYYDKKLYARFDITEDWVNGPELGKGKDGWYLEEYLSDRDWFSAYYDDTGTGMGCFREPQYLIFNHHLHIAVDDGDGGVTGFLASTSVTENKSFKNADYLIDYVRIYQKDGQKLYTK